MMIIVGIILSAAILVYYYGDLDSLHEQAGQNITDKIAESIIPLITHAPKAFSATGCAILWAAILWWFSIKLQTCLDAAASQSDNIDVVVTNLEKRGERDRNSIAEAMKTATQDSFTEILEGMKTGATSLIEASNNLKTAVDPLKETVKTLDESMKTLTSDTLPSLKLNVDTINNTAKISENLVADLDSLKKDMLAANLKLMSDVRDKVMKKYDEMIAEISNKVPAAGIIAVKAAAAEAIQEIKPILENEWKTLARNFDISVHDIIREYSGELKKVSEDAAQLKMQVNSQSGQINQSVLELDKGILNIKKTMEELSASLNENCGSWPVKAKKIAESLELVNKTLQDLDASKGGGLSGAAERFRAVVLELNDQLVASNGALKKIETLTDN